MNTHFESRTAVSNLRVCAQIHEDVRCKLNEAEQVIDNLQNENRMLQDEIRYLRSLLPPFAIRAIWGGGEVCCPLTLKNSNNAVL